MLADTKEILTEQQQLKHTLTERWSGMPGNAIRGYSKFRKVNFLEGVNKDDVEKKAMLAVLYENAYRQLRSLDETTRMLQVGSLTL